MYLKALQYMPVFTQANFNNLEPVGLATYNSASFEVNLRGSSKEMYSIL
jgi:hypothetical protein